MSGGSYVTSTSIRSGFLRSTWKGTHSLDQRVADEGDLDPLEVGQRELGPELDAEVEDLAGLEATRFETRGNRERHVLGLGLVLDRKSVV